jgi:deoxyribonuclease-4
VASRIGAHVSVSGGLVRGALALTDKIGAEAIQIFVANPRGWAPPSADPAADEAFRAACAERGLPVYVHAPYLINFGSPSAETLERSSAALEFSLRRGAAVGAAGVVVHAGSAVLGNRWDEAMTQVRDRVIPLIRDDRPRILIEATAGGGGALASDVASLTSYLAVLDDARIGVCLDTCHLHAAGHDLSTAAGLTRTVSALVRGIGPGRIGLVHVNDSRDPCGSKRDRHTTVGAGTIGLDAFVGLFSSPGLRGVPMVVETEDSSHAADIATLKSLRRQAVEGGTGRSRGKVPSSARP